MKGMNVCPYCQRCRRIDDDSYACIECDPEIDEKYLGKSLGCMLGGAAGDALSYAVEFFSHEEIVRKYGVGGIKFYELRHGKALISDDTQMSLFTAVGALRIFTLGFHPYYPNPDLTSMQDPL